MHLTGGAVPLPLPLPLPLVPSLPLELVLLLAPLLPLVLPLAPPADAAASARIELVPRHEGQRQSLFVSSSDRIDLRDDWVTKAGEDEDDNEADEDIGFMGIITVAGDDVEDDDEAAAAIGSRMLGGGELLGWWAVAGAVRGATERLPLVLAVDDAEETDEDEDTATPASS
jgi:hypothetical protein